MSSFCIHYARYHNPYQKYTLLPLIICKDGFSVSVQASRGHYCSPRVDALYGEEYVAVEVGYPSSEEPELYEYRDGSCEVFGYVPVEIVDKIIEKHGGVDYDKVERHMRRREINIRKKEIVRSFSSK